MADRLVPMKAGVTPEIRGVLEEFFAANGVTLGSVLQAIGERLDEIVELGYPMDLRNDPDAAPAVVAVIDRARRITHNRRRRNDV
jgi:hypothetical protein